MSYSQKEKKFLSKCISLKARVLISHLALKRQAGRAEGIGRQVTP